MAAQKHKNRMPPPVAATAGRQTQPRRSECPLACVLELIGDKWTLLVVRDLACGKAQFKEFAASPERIATNILSDRLERLAEHGLIDKLPSDSSARPTYRLSTRGRSLLPVLRSLADWGLANIPGTAARMVPKNV